MNDLSTGLFRPSSWVKRLLVGALAVTLTNCAKTSSAPEVSDFNRITSDQITANRMIGDASVKYQVLGKKALQSKVLARDIALVGTKRASEILDSVAKTGETTGEQPVAAEANGDDSLVLGFPIDLLGEFQVFGAVVTTVSDKKTESLGNLKLTDLPPLHVRPIVVKASADKYVFVLMGCANDCSEASAQEPLIVIPVKGVDQKTGTVLVDLSALGAELNLIQMLDPQGQALKLKTKSSKTISFDYSLSTLVFDIETRMIPLKDTTPEPPETVFTVRWYLKLTSGFNPAFESRTATKGVGFFMTDRGVTPKVTRWGLYKTEGLDGEKAPVHYFIKNVPTEYQKAFKGAFDSWNEKFKAVTGNPLLSYEFVAATDPKAKLLVPGDVRFNILEWDLVNAASYGGLGPSIANQHTGELFSANVLVQGPKIVEIYTAWFKSRDDAQNLRNEGRVMEADKLMFLTLKSIEIATAPSKVRYDLKLGKKLSFVIHSQNASLEDPLFSPKDFEEAPQGLTYEKYMEGYFHELVAHEMGHNVGLRHNFRGNLSSTGTGEPGSVSSSVMEYLGRGFRHINGLGKYDTMAIEYGYKGLSPKVLNGFCTDENVPAAGDLENTSAECSRDDATSDPFAFFEARLGRAVSMLINKGTDAAPVVSIADVAGPANAAISGVLYYAATAEQSSSEWTNFFTGGDRPTSAAGVKAYVVKSLKAKLCDKAILDALVLKKTDEAKQAVTKNVNDLQASAVRLAKQLKVITEDSELSCD